MSIIEHILCIFVNVFDVLFKCSVHSHDVDDRSEVLLQIVVAALSQNADAGNKFIFHSKIHLRKYIVPQRRKKQKCAIDTKIPLPIFLSRGKNTGFPARPQLEVR